MKENKIAKALNIIGIMIYVISLLGSIVIYEEYSLIFGDELALIISISSLLTVFIFGTLIIGFSEVIKLLHISAYKRSFTSAQTDSVIKSDELPEI